jgi:hypothetical protein
MRGLIGVSGRFYAGNVRRSVVVAVVLAGAAGTVGLTLWLLGGSSDVASGALAPPPGKTSIGVPVPLGKPFSDGLLDAKNRGDKPAVLDRASFVRLDAGLKYLGAYVLSHPRHCQKAGIPAPHECLFYTWKDKRGRVHTSRRSAVGSIEGFRVPRDGHVLKGLTIAPGQRCRSS